MLHSQNANLLRSFINITQGSYLLPGIINRPGLFVNVIYKDQVQYAKTEKRGPFRKNKTPLGGIESFSNSTFNGAIVSNTQYSTS